VPPDDVPTIDDRRGTGEPRRASDAGARPGRFRAVREIARGGMGRVLEAVDEHLDRTVAIKEILDPHPDARARFEREVEITARLEHPSIVPLYDAGTSESGAPFYVMRRVSGSPLDKLIRDATTLDERLLLLPNMLAVADAVAHAHGRRVIHRDLKPSNVLVGELGETVVIDWGLAKIIGSEDRPGEGPPRADPLQTSAGTVFGTPGFMAPEQVSAADTDERTDVYALGACLYHVLAGRPPFHGSSESEMLARTVAAEPPALTAVVTGVPRDLVTIVEKAMARDRARRYLDAGGLSEDLRRFLNGQLVASHRYRPRERVVRWLRRHRALVAVIAIALATLVTVGALSLRRIFAEQERAEAALVRERERTEDLIITQASSYLQTNPTLAIATLQQLRRESPRWQALAPFVADVRAHGIGIGYPGHGGGVTRLYLDARGRAVSAGNGVIRVTDLRERTARVLSRGHSIGARALWCGDQAVIADRGLIDVVDLAANTRTRIAWPRLAWLVATSSTGLLVFADENHQIATADLAAGTAPVPLEPPHPTAPSVLELSPSGRWLVVTVGEHTRVFRAAGSSWALAGRLERGARAVAFDAGERRLAITHGAPGQMVVDELDLERALAVGRTWPQLTVRYLAYSGDQLYGHVFPDEIHLFRDGGETHKVGTHRVLWQHASLADGVVLGTNNQFEIRWRGARHTIDAPYEITGLHASLDGRFLVAASASNLVAFDLAQLTATRTPIDVATNLVIADGHLIALEQITDTTNTASLRFERYRLDGLTPKSVGGWKLPMTSTAVPLADDRILFHDPMTGQAALEGTTKLTVIAVPAIAAVELADADTLWVASQRELHRVDRKTGKSIGVTMTADKPLAAIAARGGWLATQINDGAVWRRDPAGRVTQLERARRLLALAFGPDGSLYLATERELFAWRPGGALDQLFTLPQRIVDFRLVAGGAIAVSTTDRGLHVFDATTKRLRPPIAACSGVTFARDGSRAACLVDGAVTIVELATGERWSVLDHAELAHRGLALSADGETLFAAVRDGSRWTVHGWRLGFGAPLADWVQQATNALPPAITRNSIEWRDLAAPASFR
jgi:hypothetical protein